MYCQKSLIYCIIFPVFWDKMSELPRPTRKELSKSCPLATSKPLALEPRGDKSHARLNHEGEGRRGAHEQLLVY